MRKTITGAATAAILGTTLLLAPTGASADPTYESTGGYDFASNSSGLWRVRSQPVVTETATQSFGPGGVTLSITADPTGYADSGVIVPVGTVDELFDDEGNYIPVDVVESTPANTMVNLYFDASGDDEYLSFGSGGGYLGEGGDEIFFNDEDLETRSQVTTGDEALAWAWVGVSGAEAKSATVSAVDGKELVQLLTARPRFMHSATKSCGAVSTHVAVSDIPDGATPVPAAYNFKVTVTNRKTGVTVTPDFGRLHPGQSSSFVRSFGEDSGPRDVRIYKNGVQVRIVHVATNCR